MDEMDDFDEIALAAWRASKPPLERLYDAMLGEGNWEPGPPATRYRIHGRDGQPFACHLCGSTDRWVIEGDEVKRIARVFVCEHGAVETSLGPIRQISTVPARDVIAAEEMEVHCE